MEATRPAALPGVAPDAAQLAKATLRRLALDKLEPNPDNYARAWRQEAGEPPPVGVDGPAIAMLIERIVRGIERGSKGWTAARKKESLQRVLDGSRSDARRLQQRLNQLVASWDGDAAAAPEAAPGDEPQTVFEGLPTAPAPLQALAPLPWGRAVNALGITLQTALPARDDAPHEIALALAALT
jgi:diguanylate cyclase